jgi:ABC-type lipoprotein export system ATPase subunit
MEFNIDEGEGVILMRYITKIILENGNTNQTFELHFKPGTNIIVGPKGGGKSTLLVLLYLAHKNAKNLSDSKLSKAIWDTLKHYDIRFKSLHYSDKTIIDANTLSTAISNNEEFVTQSDSIKTKINESEEIEKDKTDFINNLVAEQAKPLIRLLDSYYGSFDEFYTIRTKRINWKIIEIYEAKKSNYLVELKKAFQNDSPRTESQTISDTLKSIALLQVYRRINSINSRVLPYIKLIDDPINIHKEDLFEIIRKASIIKSMEACVNLISLEVDKDTSSATKIKNFEYDSKVFLEELAKTLAKNSAAFFNLVSKETTIHLNNRRKSTYDIDIAIDDSIVIEQNEAKMFEIFTESLYKNKKDNTKWVEWIKASIENSTPRKKIVKPVDAIQKMLFEKISEKILLLADGKQDYNKMSLGQRTSYGLKYKISNNQTSFIFLDQPEDNIDSYTISSTLIPLLNEKKASLNQQSFIVTHNSNFGILTDPKSITSCDLSDFEMPYTQIFDPSKEVISKEIEIADSPLAHYLEGGKKALSDRYHILIKEE